METLHFLEDEWEIVNDDGFVYKRKKRRLDLTAATATSAAAPPPDPAVEAELWRQRKRKALINLKAKYQKERSQWELLSNTLNAMKLKSQTLHQTRQEHAPQPECENPGFAPKVVGGQILDELLVQVEAEEAIIQDLSNLCDLSEAFCKEQEERLKQSFIELPVWDYSPQEMMESLCED